MISESFPRYAPAGFWRRALAYFLDFSILSTLAIPVGLFVGFLEAVVQHLLQERSQTFIKTLEAVKIVITLAVAVYYYTRCYKTRGTTLGKQILGLKVIKMPYANHLSHREVFSREILGRILSTFTLGIGYLMIVFRKDKRALHDIVADTWVLKRVE